MIHLCYKGYHAYPSYHEDDRLFYGRIAGISDLVDFSCETAEELEKSFHEAVDDYLVYCREISKTPEVPKQA